MKISAITYNKIPNNSFKAGKTQIFSDFDGTYFPYHQNILREQNTHPDILKMQTMQAKMNEFMGDKKDKINLVITTGRSKAEMQYLLNNIGKNKILFFAPEYFIFRDGSEKCEIRTCEEKLDLKTQKPEPIMPKQQLKSEMKGIIKKIDPKITIFEDKINKIEKDYLDESIESEFKKAKIRNKGYASINVEDNGLVEIVFPYDYKNYSKIREEIKNWVKKNNAPVDVISKNQDSNYYIPYQKDYGNKYTCETAQSIILRPKVDDVAPDKLNAPKEAVKRIIANNTNDLVIVTGDGSNDETMLNPLNYLDLYGIKVNKSLPIDEILEDREVIKGLKKLPLVPIIAGNGKTLSHLLELKQNLDRKRIRIIQHAKDPENELLAKIKRGMHEYSDRNDEYKYGLGRKLYSEILD